MTTQQPEALAQECADYATSLRSGANVANLKGRAPSVSFLRAADLFERAASRITELESQLAQRFDAADVATASAQGFRDGVASVSAGSEPVAWKHDCAALLANDVELWIDACPHCGKPRMHATQAAHPSPPEGMAGRLQVYRCKIKSKKQIDKEIPREQQGWWADVAAGQKLLLRQAVQSDLDRCTLGGKRSRNPADYMCETQTNGSLVSKVALEYMNPEQNVFAAAPGPADGESK